MINHLSEYLLIKPGGKLLFLSGGFSKEKIEKDATDSITKLLPMQCRVDPEATFKDILLLVQSKIDFFDELIGLYCREFVKEGLSQDIPREPGTYLELYWRADNSMGVVEGLDYPSVHEVIGEERDSSRALSFVPSYQFSPLPVRLNHEAKLYQWVSGKEAGSPPKLHCEEHTLTLGFTLFQILYGIFWEMSFFSHPSNREQKAAEILGREGAFDDETTDPK